MILFPAIDILDQKCVRLTQGDYQLKTTYNNDPASVAVEFEQQGRRIYSYSGFKCRKIWQY